MGCEGGTGGGGTEVGTTYSVDFTGSVSGNSGDDLWTKHGKWIVPAVKGELPTTINLSYIDAHFDELAGFDTECFDGSPFEVTGAIIRKTKGNETEAWYWLTALTTGEGNIDGEEAIYLFQTSGTFIDDHPTWPPTEADPTTSMMMNSWFMNLENGQQELEDEACEGGQDPGEGFLYTINVYHLNTPS